MPGIKTSELNYCFGFIIGAAAAATMICTSLGFLQKVTALERERERVREGGGSVANPMMLRFQPAARCYLLILPCQIARH